MGIRLAVPEDRPAIVEFLRRHWRADSVLVTNPELFDYQYMRRSPCGFVITEDEETGKLLGVKGFLPLNSEAEPDVTAALVLALKGSRPMLNMEMQRFLEKATHSRMMYALGLNPNTAARIYPFFRYKTGSLHQYYKLGKTNEFRVAKIVNRPPEHPAEGGLRLIPLSDMDELLRCFDPAEWKENRPYKDTDYIRYRYFDNPFYRYNVYGASRNGKHADSILITREIICMEHLVIRVVDFIGRREDFSDLGTALERLMAEKPAEYIDFFCYGLPDGAAEAAGLTLRKTDDENIIPNYFEPFVQKNVEINFFCNLHDNFLICKADGDQDRPSVLTGSKRGEEG